MIRGGHGAVNIFRHGPRERGRFFGFPTILQRGKENVMAAGGKGRAKKGPKPKNVERRIDSLTLGNRTVRR
jgi:hypothetical protein